MRRSICCLIAIVNLTLLNSACLAEDWREAWSMALEFYEEGQSSEAMQWFDRALTELEAKSEVHSDIYIDRAVALIDQKQYERAISDLNKALLNEDISVQEKAKAHLQRWIARCSFASEAGLLEDPAIQDDILADLRLFAQFYHNMPRMELTENRIILRNAPNCECYEKLMKGYFLGIGACQSESDIKIYDSGTWIIRRNIDCKCSQLQGSRSGEDNCKQWCNRTAIAVAPLCGQFRTAWCQVGCAAAINQINEACHMCCAGGTFYQNCIRPFSDVLGYMARTIGRGCDPLTD